MLKKQLYKQCEIFVSKQLATVNHTISLHQKALESETKSSAGDKHETGRAMLQLEIEKAGKQLAEIRQMQTVLNRIAITKTSEKIHLGSVVFTDQLNYFVSISAGKISFDGNDFYAISMFSPIGKLLLGKQKNDLIFFRKSIKIIKIL